MQCTYYLPLTKIQYLERVRESLSLLHISIAQWFLHPSHGARACIILRTLAESYWWFLIVWFFPAACAQFCLPPTQGVLWRNEFFPPLRTLFSLPPTVLSVLYTTCFWHMDGAPSHIMLMPFVPFGFAQPRALYSLPPPQASFLWCSNFVFSFTFQMDHLNRGGGYLAMFE